MERSVKIPDEQVQERLRQLLEEALPLPVQRRAHIILLYGEGKPTRQVAEEVGLSRRQVRSWRQRYEQDGLSISPPEPQRRLAWQINP